MSVAGDLLSYYQHVIERLHLVTGSSGVFDVVVDGEVLYSKGETGRHADAGEVLGLFEATYAQDVSRYGT